MTKLNLRVGDNLQSNKQLLDFFLILCKLLFVAALLLVKKFQLHLGRKKLNNACKQFSSRYLTPLLLTPGACDCPCTGAGWLTFVFSVQLVLGV